MAKVPFTKLKCKINDSVKEVKITDDITIEIKQYLPIQDKLALIGRVISLAHMQDENYSNPVKAATLRDLEIVFDYTNISFTDKQKEEPSKLYDLLYSSGILNTILENIPASEYDSIVTGVTDSITAVYAYQNSVFGILDGLKKDYSDLDFDVNAISSKLTDEKSLGFVKDILTKLG